MLLSPTPYDQRKGRKVTGGHNGYGGESPVPGSFFRRFVFRRLHREFVEFPPSYDLGRDLLSSTPSLAP